jgi:hypothetical protein
MDTRPRYGRIVLVVIVLCALILPLLGITYLGERIKPSLHRTSNAPSLALDGDRIHFFQPGYSLTTLDLATGRVLLRGPSARPDMDWTSGSMRIMGNLIASNDFIVDKRDGKAYTTEWRRGRDYLRGNLFYFLNGRANVTLDTIDIETGEMRTLADVGTTGDFLIEGDRLFVLEKKFSKQSSALHSWNLRGGEEFWRPVDTRYGHLLMLYGTLYVLPWLPSRDKPITDPFMAFTPSGEILPDVTPAEERHKKVSDLYFNRTSAREGYYDEAQKLLNKRFENRYDFIRNSALLPGHAAAGCAFLFGNDETEQKWSDPQGLSRKILLYADDTVRWERRINCLQYAERLEKPTWIGSTTYYSFEPDLNYLATEKYLLYSTNNGKVECIEKASGRSAWIYSYSRFSLPSWQTGTSFFRPRFSVAD